jgi:prepilin-type processing-associated H-X9-DG protein
LLLPYLEQRNPHQLYDFSANWWEGTNLAVAAIPLAVFRCSSTPQLTPPLSIIAKPPRPALQLNLPLAATDYEAIQGVQPASINPLIYNSQNRFAVMHRNSSTRFGDITDGTSQTLCVIECAGRPVVFRRRQARLELNNDQGIGWVDSEGAFSLDGSSNDGEREGCTTANGCSRAMNARNDNEPYSFHPDGINVLFADGHVQFLAESVSLDVMAALCTRAAADKFDGSLFE